MRRRTVRIITAALVAAFVAHSWRLVRATSCVHSDDVNVAFREADVVMAAEVLAVTSATSAWGRAGLWARRLWAVAAKDRASWSTIDERQSSIRREYQLRVLERFKGALQAEERLYTPEAASAPDLRAGQKYVIYAYYLHDKAAGRQFLVTALCSKTGPLAGRQAEIDLLRELRDRQ
jgi:hypothetical protein